MDLFRTSRRDWLAIDSNEPKNSLAAKHAIFRQKQGSNVDTNSILSFLSEMLGIKEKDDFRMCHSDDYGDAESTLQECDWMRIFGR